MPYPVWSILAGIVVTAFVVTGLAQRLARLGFPLPPAERRLGCIDGLRGYLALSVFIHHFIVHLQMARLGGAWTEPGIAAFNEMGAGAVALFFMVTGLLFYPRVLAGWRAVSWPSVYISRAFRLMPLVLFSGLIATLIAMGRTGTLPDQHYPLALAKWMAGWGATTLVGYRDAKFLNAQVLWSLRYEWIFYLALLPATALAMDAARARRWPSWTVPLGLLAATGLVRLFWPGARLALCLPLFALGMLAFEAHRLPRLQQRLQGPAAGGLALLALGIAVVCFPMPYGGALGLFFLFFLCVACGNGFGGVLTSRAALVLGECSFGIYLLHGFALSLLFGEGAGLIAPVPTAWLPLLALPLLGVAVVLVSAAGFLAIERPAMVYGAQLARRWSTGKAAPQPAANVGRYAA